MTLKTFLSTTTEYEQLHKLTQINGEYVTNGFSVLILCLHSDALISFSGQEHKIEKDTAIFIGSGQSFKMIEKTREFKCAVCLLEDQSLTEILYGDVLYHFKHLAYRPRVFQLNRENAKLCYFLMQRASDISDGEYHFRNEMAASYVKVMMYAALEMTSHNAKNELLTDKRENIITDRFIELCRIHFKDTRKIKDYASMLSISPKYLSSCVLSSSGRHAYEWLDDFCIREIKTRLNNNMMTVQQISYDLNFATPSHMSHYFSKKTGITPKEYRLGKTASIPWKDIINP